MGRASGRAARRARAGGRRSRRSWWPRSPWRCGRRSAPTGSSATSGRDRTLPAGRSHGGDLQEPAPRRLARHRDPLPAPRPAWRRSARSGRSSPTARPGRTGWWRRRKGSRRCTGSRSARRPARGLCEDAAASGTGEPGPAETDANCTNEFPPVRRHRESPTPEPTHPCGRRPRSAGARPGSGRGWTRRAGWPPCRWSRPIPSARPNGARCCSRSSPRSLRRAVGHGAAEAIECLLLPDMAAYEEWFARQPKRRAGAGELARPPSTRAMVERGHPRTTRPGSRASTCPTGARRCPRLCELLGRPAPRRRRGRAAPARGDRRPAATIATPLAEPCAPGSPACSTAAPRGRPDELDLAEAVCAADAGRTGAPIAARSTSSCCAGRSTAAPSTARP